MEFLYRNNDGSISVKIFLEPVSKRGLYYSKLVKQKEFISLLNEHYLPTDMDGVGSYIFEDKKFALLIENPQIGTLSINAYAEKAYKEAQAKVTEAISDYEKITKMLELVKKEEEICK